MTQDEMQHLTDETIDEMVVELDTLLRLHARPGRSMFLALVLSEGGQGAGKVVATGDALLEGAEGLEFLAAQLRSQA